MYTISGNHSCCKGAPQIVICPTKEASWGISDDYHVKCTLCHKIILTSASIHELNAFLEKQNYNLIFDKEYK